MNQPQYKWDERHAQIFNDTIEALDKSDVRYFVLRNYEGLPEKNESKDVDLIIEPGKYRIAAECLYKAFKKNCVSRYYVVKYERIRCWLGMDLDNDFSIHIDLIEGYLNKGFEIFTFNELYRHTRQYKNMKVLDDNMDTVMLLLYKVIGCKELKLRYREKIETQYKLHSEAINNILSDALYGNVLYNLIKYLENSDFDRIINNAGKISKNSKYKSWRRKPFNTTINILKFLSEKLYRIVW
ncbi:MAG: hypothetical protein LUD00_11105, partial [Prevotellaceae bacterium]|nr:hypothetical protein [Prevotellaceae bacterium]